jgi:hypothetical protein
MRWRRKGSVTTKDIHVIDWRQFPNFNGWQAKADEALVKKTKTEIADSMLVLFESIQIRWQPDWLYMEACSLFDPRVLGRVNANTMMTPYLQRLKTRYPNLIEDHHLLVVSTTLALDAAVPPWDGISCVVAWYDNLRKQDEAYIPFVLFALNHLVTIPASVICESTFTGSRACSGTTAPPWDSTPPLLSPSYRRTRMAKLPVLPSKTMWANLVPSQNSPRGNASSSTRSKVLDRLRSRSRRRANSSSVNSPT